MNFNSQLRTVIFTALVTAPICAKELSYNSTHGAYQTADSSGDAASLIVNIKRPIGTSFFIEGLFSHTNHDYRQPYSSREVEATSISGGLGIGYHYGITRSTDIVTSLSYMKVSTEIESYGDSDDSSSTAIEVGIRTMFSRSLEGSVSIGKIKVDSNEVIDAIEAGLDFFVLRDISFGVYVTESDLSSAKGIRLGWHF